MSEMLNLEKDSGEKWIANLIRSARLDAKIDIKSVNKHYIYIYFYLVFKINKC